MSTTRRELRTYADRREYLKKAVAERRRKLKLRAVNMMGGKCMLCSYSLHVGVLDFHHVDPVTKSFGISSGGFSRSWNSIYLEIQKCILVCANCHREIELGLRDQQEIDDVYKNMWIS